MARVINWEEPLSDEDRAWAEQRDWLRPKIEENDAQFGKGEAKQESPEEELARLEGELAERQNRIQALRAEMATTENVAVVGDPATGNTRVDNTPVNGEAPEGATPAEAEDYSDTVKWTKASLTQEIERRNVEREADGLEALRTSGNRSELVERLMQDDRELADSDTERGE